MDEKENVILIISDTFRHDLLFENFVVKKNVRAKTPYLNRFAKESLVFTRAYHASFPTVPNRHDILTGRYTFIYSDWAPLPRDERVLSLMLKEKEYTSVMIADTPHILKDGYHFDRGFDAWVWIRGQENDRYRTDPIDVQLPCSPQKLRNVKTTIQHMRNNAYRLVEEDWIPAKTAKTAAEWLEKNYKRKFFMYIDFFDPHEPWDPPRWYIDMYDPDYEGEEVTYPVYGPTDYLSKEELEHCRAMYAGEATLVDRWIGFLLEKIDELGLFENTTVIFTADHGFYLGEHNLIGKSIIMGDAHGLAPLYEEVAHIPLLIRLSDNIGKKHQIIENLVQTPDITATILDIAGVIGETQIEGFSLLPLARGEDLEFRDFAVSSPSIIRGVRSGLRPTITTDEWALILASQESPKMEEVEYTMIVDGEPRILKPFGKIETELYNLRKDPKQQYNVLEDNKDIAKELRDMFIDFLYEKGAKEEYIVPWKNCKGID